MKKIRLLSIGLMLSAVTSFAQTTVADLKTGYTFLGPVAGIGSSWIGYMPVGGIAKTSGYAGVSLIKLNNPHWGWGGQIRLSSEGYKIESFSNAQVFRPLYLRVPARAYYFFGRRSDWLRPNIYLGPSAAVKLSEYNVAGNIYQDYYVVHNSSYFRTLDIGVNGGVGLDFRLSHKTWLNLDLDYYHGLVDAVDDASNEYNPNRTLNFSLSVLFNLR